MPKRFKLWLAKKLLRELTELGVPPEVFFEPMSKGYHECYYEDNLANRYWFMKEGLDNTPSFQGYVNGWLRNGSYGHFKSTRGNPDVSPNTP
jgi:hypothetical protein